MQGVKEMIIGLLLVMLGLTAVLLGALVAQHTGIASGGSIMFISGLILMVIGYFDKD